MTIDCLYSVHIRFNSTAHGRVVLRLGRCHTLVCCMGIDTVHKINT